MRLALLSRWRALPLLLLCSTPAFAQLADCEAATIQTAIDAADPGDTIQLPTDDCSWVTLIDINIGIRLLGNGVGNTNISDDCETVCLDVDIPAGQVFELADMTITCSSDTSAGFASINGESSGDQVYVHDLDLDDYASGVCGPAVFNVQDVFGVFTRLDADGGFGQYFEQGHSTFGGAGSFGDLSWASAPALSSSNFLFVEDSDFANTSTLQSIGDCNGNACRVVWRYNHLHHYRLGFHGTESPGRPRSGRIYQVYGNTFSSVSGLGGSGDRTIQYRGGTGVYFLNTADGTTNPAWNTGIDLITHRATASLGAFGRCDGTGLWDDNDLTDGAGTPGGAGDGVFEDGTHTGGDAATVLTDSAQSWTPDEWVVNGAPYSIVNTTQGWGSEITDNDETTITRLGNAFSQANDWDTGDAYEIRRALHCIDQTGTGQSDLLSGNPATPEGYPQNAVEPIYVVNNNWDDADIPNGIISSSTARVIPDRDFFYEDGAFDGSSGCGTGTAAEMAMITGTTTGVCFFVTDEADWNSGEEGPDGQIYTWDGDSWELHFRPYCFPHPLDSGVPCDDAGAFVPGAPRVLVRP